MLLLPAFGLLLVPALAPISQVIYLRIGVLRQFNSEIGLLALAWFGPKRWASRLNTGYRQQLLGYAKTAQCSLIKPSGDIQVAVLLILANRSLCFRSHVPVDVAFVEALLLKAPLRGGNGWRRRGWCGAAFDGRPVRFAGGCHTQATPRLVVQTAVNGEVVLRLIVSDCRASHRAVHSVDRPVVVALTF